MTAISTSEQTCYLRCPREHYYRYTLGRVPKITPNGSALRIGSAVHENLERWFLGEGTVLDYWSLIELTPRERVLVEELLHGYFQRYTKTPWRVVAIEQEFKVPIAGGIVGVLDLVVATPHNEILIVEHKTEHVRSAWEDRVMLDSQVSNYLLAAQFLGYCTNKLVYDVIVKPAIQETASGLDHYRERLKDLLQAQPETYYKRLIVERTDDELEEARQRIMFCKRGMRREVQPMNP